MKKRFLLLLILIYSLSSFSQEINLLQLNEKLEGVHTTFVEENYNGITALKVVPKKVQSEAKFVKVNIDDFINGTIEIDVVGKRLKDAGKGARGFVGFAFRINDDNSQFESFYIRPTNGRSNDQLRRNHSVQYFSFPNFPWHKLRKETPGKYETYTDLEEGVWTQLKMVVAGNTATLYVNGAEQPTLIVNDLKLGTDIPGKLGLWVGPGTEAYFANLKITKE